MSRGQQKQGLENAEEKKNTLLEGELLTCPLLHWLVKELEVQGLAAEVLVDPAWFREAEEAEFYKELYNIFRKQSISVETEKERGPLGSRILEGCSCPTPS